MRVVYLEWHDASGCNGWHDHDDIIGSLTLVRTVGFVHSESEHALVIAQNFDQENNRWGDTTNVPRVGIVYQQELKQWP